MTSTVEGWFMILVLVVGLFFIGVGIRSWYHHRRHLLLLTSSATAATTTSGDEHE